MPASNDPHRLLARLRFRHLQLLVALKEGGSLRAAAGVLNFTQPALSKALGEVESAFGFALFVRSARGLVPTPRGDVVVRGAALLMAELAHVQAEAASEGGITLLRIGAPPFVAQGYVPQAMAALTRLEPRLRVELMEERVPMILRALVEGRVDALITSFPAALPAEVEAQSLRHEKLFDADFDVIAPAGHPLAKARRVSWQQLAQERWIMPSRISMVQRMMEEVFRREGVMPPVPVIESTSPVTNLRLVAAGLGVSAVPRATLASVGVEGVCRLRVQPAIPAGPVGLIYRAQPVQPRVALLRQALGLAPDR
ncbi:MAG: LysR family transcriptional regulator [Proteobacteria bacterium]|nr:LysR family transcriptional regulator [Pseudomonadota bacterium]